MGLPARQVDDDDATPARCGRYETWRSLDPRHCALMDCLSRQADDSEMARLWLGVIDQALVDAFTPRPRTETFWATSAHHWLRSAGFDDACSNAGLNPSWARRQISVAHGAHR